MTAADFQALLVLEVLGGMLGVLMLLVALVRSHRLAAAATAVGLVLALILLFQAAEVAPRQVTPLVIVDGYGLFLSALFLAAALVVTVISPRYLSAHHRDDPEEYYLLLLAATLGAVTLACASHFATLLLGLEILSVALYVLVAYPRHGHPPLEAALKYLILSGAASTTLLFGMALIYAATGSLAFAEIGDLARLEEAGTGPVRLLGAGVVMLLAGASFKLSLVPFHMWTPDVYQGAPAPVAGYLASVSKGAMMAVLVRLLLQTDALSAPLVVHVLVVLALLSMLIGNLLALRQQSIKRVLAYSAIAHFGYLLVPLVALGATEPALASEAVLIYLAAYFAMTLGAFAVITVLSGGADNEADELDRYAGLFWRRPLPALVLTLALLSLAGIPLTVGFIAKFYLFATGVSVSAWLLLAGLVLGSGIGLYYYLRIIFAMTRDPGADAPAPMARIAGASWSSGLTLCVLGALLVLFGVYPAPLIEVVQQALESWGG